MPKRTTGTWQFDWEKDGVYSINADAGRTWKHVALVKSNGDGSATVSAEEAEANARLIAAAPDLLAACEAVLNRENYQGTGEPWSHLFKQVRAARTKATGK